MNEFFMYSSFWRIALIMMAVTVLVVNSFFLQAALPTAAYGNWRRHVLEGSALLLPLLIVSIFYVLNSLFEEEILVMTNYGIVRYGLFLLILVQAWYWWRRSARMGLLLGAALLSLPWSDYAMPYNFLAVIMLLLYRIYSLYPAVKEDLQHQITAHSIQDGINTLKTGVLFSHANGEIVLINAAMLNYMDALVFHQFRNAHVFWNTLHAFPAKPGVVKETMGDKLLFHLPSGESLLFSRLVLAGQKGRDIQITCTDVTEEAGLARELNQQNQVLKNRTAQLRHMLKDIEKIQQTTVFAEVTSRVHDLMGQRITIFQQLLKNKRYSDYPSIIPLVEGVMADIRQDVAQSPQDVFDNLVQAFRALDIDVVVQGHLPEEASCAPVFVEICREALTNAVLHGNASRIDIRFYEQAGRYGLAIGDNGRSCQDLKPGQGLRGMKEKMAALGGTLTIRTEPTFTIQAETGGKS